MDKYRRRHYFIDRSYQGGVVARIVMICSAGMLLELGLFNYLSYGNIESMRWKTHIGIERISEIVSFYLVYSSLFSIFVTVGVLYLFLSSVLKKTAGPIYRLNKDIGSAADGNLSLSIWLRGEDDFKETAAELDRMVAATREDFAMIIDSSIRIGRTVEVLEYVIDKPAIAAGKCQQLIDYLEPLKKIK